MSTMASNAVSMPQNMLLAALPAAEWEWAGRDFKPIFMPHGDVAYAVLALSQ